MKKKIMNGFVFTSTSIDKTIRDNKLTTSILYKRLKIFFDLYKIK